MQAKVETVVGERQRPEKDGVCRFAFCASTGRTATMFVSKTLNGLADVRATHEGHLLGNPPEPVLPLINFQNRKAWHDPAFAVQTAAALRSVEHLSVAAGDASVFVDVAFNNAPFMAALSDLHPSAHCLAIFRRCGNFVRSATIVSGEDPQPAGWPDLNKPLTDREKFVELGRLKPAKGSEDHDLWAGWSAIQRNIWLWSTVNAHLVDFIGAGSNRTALRFEDLETDPPRFWDGLLTAIGANSSDNLRRCVNLSKKKTNQRTAYQIGPVSDWSDAERAFYEARALPLEEQIYGG